MTRRVSPRRSSAHPGAAFAKGAKQAGQSPAGSVSLCLQLLYPLLELGCDGRIAQRGDIAQRVTLGDVAQQPTHDLSRARLGEVLGPDDPLGARELADALGDGRANALDSALIALEIALQSDERDDRLPGVLVVLSDHC